MSTTNMAEFYRAALEAAGGPASEILPKNRYHLRIKTVKPGNAKTSGKFQVGIRFEVIDGEHAGKNCWINQTLTVENPKAFGVFLKYMLQLGVPQSALDAGTPADQLSGYIVIGTEGYGDLDQHQHGDKTYQDLKGFQIISVPTITTSGVQIPTGPVMAPSVTAPPVVAVPAPVAVPVAPVPVAAPAVVASLAAPAADASTIAALQAQLAALQGQTAPAAPAAPVAGVSVPF